MMIELEASGVIGKVWFARYELGPYPMSAAAMLLKEQQLKICVLGKLLEESQLIYPNDWKMYVTVRSNMNPAAITTKEFTEFNILANANSIKRRIGNQKSKK